VGRAADGAVDVGEAAAAGFIPRPDFGGDVVGGATHCKSSARERKVFFFEKKKQKTFATLGPG
jgi:hypothetical protein